MVHILVVWWLAVQCIYGRGGGAAAGVVVHEILKSGLEEARSVNMQSRASAVRVVVDF